MVENVKRSKRILNFSYSNNIRGAVSLAYLRRDYKIDNDIVKKMKRQKDSDGNDQ